MQFDEFLIKLYCANLFKHSLLIYTTGHLESSQILDVVNFFLKRDSLLNFAFIFFILRYRHKSSHGGN